MCEESRDDAPRPGAAANELSTLEQVAQASQVSVSAWYDKRGPIMSKLL